MTDISKKKATIYDISVLSGSSPSTVSVVLNGNWRKRRIKESTAEFIQKVAAENGYTTNLQARGLRYSRSGLVGLILPVYDNRYFSSMAQNFEAMVRSRGQCPIVVSTCRDPKEERQVVETLLSYSVDELFIAGATDPDGIHDICQKAGIRHINLDLPGAKAPSVISDNFEGARILTRAILESALENGPITPEEVFLFGGRNDYASRERIRGFRDMKHSMLGKDPEDCVRTTGYSPGTAASTFETFYQEYGKLPRCFFVNSTINMEGLLRFLGQHPTEHFSDIVVGCYDYDPFGSFLPFTVFMVRQDSETMIAKGFSILDEPHPDVATHLVMPTLVPPRTALSGPLDALNDIE